MKNQTQSTKNGAILYLVLALVIAGMIAVSLYTVISSLSKPAPQTPSQSTEPPHSETEERKPSRHPDSTSEKPADLPKDTQSDGKDVLAPQDDPDDKGLTFILPVKGSLAKAYDRDILVYSVTMNDYRLHTGLDLEAPLGSAVFAVADGTVQDIYNDPFWGMCIEISHNDGWSSVCRGVSAELPDGIFEGCKVQQGQTIAAVGETALIEIAEEPHLHFELYHNKEGADPQKHLPELTTSSSEE